MSRPIARPHLLHPQSTLMPPSVRLVDRREALCWSLKSLGLGLGVGLFQGCSRDALLVGDDEVGLGVSPSPPLSLVQHLRRFPAIDVLLLGEQHDAPEHQALHQTVLAAWGQTQDLRALVLEMAEMGRDTHGMSSHSGEALVQARLAWSEAAWPWAVYGPMVMTAVAQGIPVLGGNLPRQRHREVMQDAAWDARVSAQTRQALEVAVDEGHCKLLPSAQLRPMTRIQIARDASLAQTITHAMTLAPSPEASERPPRTVLVVCGHQHAHKQHGIPAHLSSTLAVHSVRLSPNVVVTPTSGLARPVAVVDAAFDTVWPTQALPPKDYCATLMPKN